MNNGASALYRTRNADRKIELEWHDTSCNKNMFRMEVVHTIADGDTVVCSINQTSEKKKYDLSAQSASRKPCSRVPYELQHWHVFFPSRDSVNDYICLHMIHLSLFLGFANPSTLSCAGRKILSFSFLRLKAPLLLSICFLPALYADA